MTHPPAPQPHDNQRTSRNAPNPDSPHPVLILGAGIAGMAAALHLAELGLPVHLLDAAPAIGGSMHLLDHSFPTNSCGICLMLPHQPALCPTFECDAHPLLHLLPYAQLLDLTGQPGNFTATLRHKARYVDVDACSRCGLCATVCPELRPHDHEGWLHPVKAIYRPPGLRAVPDAWLIDMDYCTRCGECVHACPTGAIHLDMPDHHQSLQVAALLLAPGFAPFDARLKGEYGYGRYDNVLSALEFERMASLAGSTSAHLHRPSDARPPHNLAFIHCVGSRDNLHGAGHCSAACCMYTAKQVALAKQLDPNLDITVFFIDIRAYGKDFEAYFDRVQALPGVTYRRTMPSALYQLQQSRDLLITYVAENGQLREEQFNMAVLATGFAPPQDMQHLAHHLNVQLNDYGFAATSTYLPTRTSRPGIFVAGAFREPKDIPDTVAEAAAAAADIAAALHSRPANTDPTSQPAPRDVSDEEPKLGVFVCHCHDDLAAIDIPHLLAQTQALPGVALAQAVPNGCTPDGLTTILATIQAQALNRVVLAGCSHRRHADALEDTMRRAGLDPRLLARVNLRDQVLYPHSANGANLTQKAYSLLAMAVAQLQTMTGLQALHHHAHQPLTRRALVVGGGAAGLTAALHLAALDIPVHLVERSDQLGGQWRHIRHTPDGSNPQTALQQRIAQVHADDRITLHLNTRLTSLHGGPGHYHATLTTHDGLQQTLEHGALLVATGGQPATTRDYLYGLDPRVLTQRELEQQIHDATLATAQTVVMIQCAGSREPERPYCSRICCTQAVRNALKLKKLRPSLNLYLLYRELRTYGCREADYQAARDAGVIFLRYDLPLKPQVQARGQSLHIQLTEPVTGLPLELNADLLVLSVGIQPNDADPLAATLAVDLNNDGFFQEEHPKMKPLDLHRPGLFVAGLAHSPRSLDETITQAQGAAMRIAAFLAPHSLTDQPTSVWVNDRLCSFCGLCVDACPYQARIMNHNSRLADVDYALCLGCGVCAVVCPNKATLQKAFEHKQLLSAIDMALV